MVNTRVEREGVFYGLFNISLAKSDFQLQGHLQPATLFS
jgi:hypothetical protein